MRAVIFQHERLEGPGLLEGALERAGFDLDVRFREVRPGDEDAALVVVLGGTPGAHEPELAPLLADEIAVLRERLERGLPSLGICLGAQLLAAAAGGDVVPGEKGIELGVLPVALTDAGHEDPVFGPMPAVFEAMCWHGDTFELVPEATLLAASERYAHQAFRLQSSYGLQFHPELTPRMLAGWFDAWEEALAAGGRTRESVEEDDLPRLSEAVPQLAGLIERMAQHLAASARG